MCPEFQETSILKVKEKCVRITRNRSNHKETVLIEDLLAFIEEAGIMVGLGKI